MRGEIDKSMRALADVMPTDQRAYLVHHHTLEFCEFFFSLWMIRGRGFATTRNGTVVEMSAP